MRSPEHEDQRSSSPVISQKRFFLLFSLLLSHCSGTCGFSLAGWFMSPRKLPDSSAAHSLCVPPCSASLYGFWGLSSGPHIYKASSYLRVRFEHQSDWTFQAHALWFLEKTTEAQSGL